MKHTYIKRFAGILLVMITQCIYSQIPRTLSYQGVLTDSSGNPKPDGVYSLTFRLYETSIEGTAIWTESKDIDVKRGLFSTILGDQSAIGSDIIFDKPYWLSLQLSPDPELLPRLPLTAVGYSLYSVRSDTAMYSVNNPSGWTTSGDAVGLSKPSDKVGIGVSDPVTKLEVDGLVRVNSIISWPNSGKGLELGYSPGLKRGYIQVYDRDSAKWGELYLGDSKIGVGGFSADKFTVNGTIRSLSGGFVFPDGSTQTTAVSSSSGITLPYTGSAAASGNVFEITNTGNGKGVFGKHNISSNYGYLGSVDNGVYGESSKDGIGPLNPAGAGVYGKHTSAGYGVYGTSVNGLGVNGYSTNGYGVLGRAGTTGSAGVYGIRGSNLGQLGTELDGVYGETSHNSGSGVAGVNNGSGQGVYGVNKSSGQSGQLGGPDYGVKAEGDLIVTGAYKGDIGPNLGAPFPRPAWDSNWGAIGIAETKILYHNIGGDVDNYVVDMMFKDGEGKISGPVNYWDVIYKGARWFELTTESIKVRRDLGDFWADKVRIRIWVYK